MSNNLKPDNVIYILHYIPQKYKLRLFLSLLEHPRAHTHTRIYTAWIKTTSLENVYSLRYPPMGQSTHSIDIRAGLHHNRNKMLVPDPKTISIKCMVWRPEMQGTLIKWHPYGDVVAYHAIRTNFRTGFWWFLFGLSLSRHTVDEPIRYSGFTLWEQTADHFIARCPYAFTCAMSWEYSP